MVVESQPRRSGCGLDVVGCRVRSLIRSRDCVECSQVEGGVLIEALADLASALLRQWCRMLRDPYSGSDWFLREPY